ncbi:MAG: hypothetical protein KDC53_15480 [Saprospiraceae bacterium]|nr:hypothetical protein [Saprospiraceae bacterium]
MILADAFELYKNQELDLTSVSSGQISISKKDLEQIREHQKNLIKKAAEEKFNQLKKAFESKSANWRATGFSTEEIVKKYKSEILKFKQRQENQHGNFALSELPQSLHYNERTKYFDARWQALMKGKYSSDFFHYTWYDPEDPIVVYQAQKRYIKVLSDQLTRMEVRRRTMRVISLFHFYKQKEINSKNAKSIAESYGYLSLNSGKKLGSVYRSILNPEERQKDTSENHSDLKQTLELLQESSVNTKLIADEITIVEGKIYQKGTGS